MHTRRLVGGALVISVAVTVLIAVWPELPFGVRDPALHVALESAAGVVALLAGIVAYGRFRQRLRASDLLLATAFLMFGVINLGLSMVPAVLAEGISGFGVWAPLAGRVLATAVLCLAAFQSLERTLTVRPGHLILGAAAGVLGLVAAVIGTLGDTLPAGIGLVAERRAVTGLLAGHPAVTAAQLLALGLYAGAATGFTRLARRGDGFAAWLAAACVLAGTARVHYLIHPSLYSDFVYSGDWLRLGFYATVLAASAREVTAYWRRLADGAVLEERQRLAHALHDGLAQELALAAGQARMLAKRDPSPQAQLVASAAQRALDESRRAMAALTRPLDEPLHGSLTSAVEDVTGRLRAEVELDLDRDVHVPTDTREAMLRIAREAVTNAVQHSRASHIAVALSGHSPVRLVVSDDGVGFDLASARPSTSGFGLTGMAEQAAAAGLRFRLRSAVGSGTRVEVEAP